MISALQILVRRLKLESGLYPTDLKNLFEESFIKDLDYSIFLEKRYLDDNYDIKGRKLKDTFFIPNTKIIAVERQYTDKLDTSSNLIGLDIKHVWYTYPSLEDIEDVSLEYAKGDVYTDKDTSVLFNNYKINDQKRKRRHRVIDLLIEGSKDTPLFTHVDTLYHHYKDEIFLFFDTGSSELADALNNETDPAIVILLNTIINPTDPVDEQETLKETVLKRL